MSLSFLIDEDISDELASALRRLGYNAVSVYDISRTGLSDEEQFAFAQKKKRTLVTRNIRDFVVIAEGS
jgi:predicted nuclease of predicted toxin-antitoxin system